MTRPFAQLATAILHGMRAVDYTARNADLPWKDGETPHDSAMDGPAVHDSVMDGLAADGSADVNHEDDQDAVSHVPTGRR